MARISGSFFERRPSASSSPSGKHSVMPATARNRLSMTPPQSVTSSGTRRNRMSATKPTHGDAARGTVLIVPAGADRRSRPTTAATIGAEEGEPRPDRRHHRQEDGHADEQRPQPPGRAEGDPPPRDGRSRRHAPGDDPPPADEPGRRRRRSSAINGDGDGDPPQLVARVAADHEQPQVDPHDLPPAGDEHVADGPVDDVADDDRRHDGHDAVAGRAEQVVADPVAGPGGRGTLGLGRRHGRWLRRRSCSRAARPHRSTIARRRLKRLTISEITSEMAR